MRRFASDHGASTETGGALFGIEARRDLNIVDATPPGPQALHEPTRFLRDLDYTHQRALEIYGRTGAEWVGEWHTHPTHDLAPSPLDLATYYTHLQDPSLDFVRFIAIIIDPANGARRAALWTFTPESAVGRRLRL